MIWKRFNLDFIDWNGGFFNLNYGFESCIIFKNISSLCLKSSNKPQPFQLNKLRRNTRNPPVSEFKKRRLLRSTDHMSTEGKELKS